MRAVDGISFTIRRGDTLGLVGESGCGKTTTAKIILGMYHPTSGSVRFEGQDLNGPLSRTDRRTARRNIQAVFQDPAASLDPRMKIGQIIEEPMVIHDQGTPTDRRETALGILQAVGLKRETYSRYAHELSGRQTAGCDRTGADPQAQAHRLGRACLGTGHVGPGTGPEPAAGHPGGLRPDLPLHRPRPQRRALHVPQHRGHVPREDSRDVRDAGALREPASPLHEGASRCRAGSRPDKDEPEGPSVRNIPSPMDLPEGCRFHTRCPAAMEVCSKIDPVLQEVSKGHFVACHLYDGKI